jgi:hypothetical protein
MCRRTYPSRCRGPFSLVEGHNSNFPCLQYPIELNLQTFKEGRILVEGFKERPIGIVLDQRNKALNCQAPMRNAEEGEARDGV